MKTKTTPLSFEIDAELAANLEKLRTLLGGVSFSKLIDHAIEQFDYKKVSRKTSGKRRQLSVRLADKKRTALERISKSEKASMAYLIRMALESLTESATKKNVQKELKMALASKKAKPAKKAAAKKRARKAVKKTVAKKTVAKKKVVKKAAKKPAAKKKVVKKAAKKPAAKKKAAKKAD